MIQKHYTLSCYVMEQPFTAVYSRHHEQDIFDFIDGNNDIYEFKLSRPQIYEKITNEKTIRQICRVGLVWLVLDTQGGLVVRRNAEEMCRFEDVEQIQVLQMQQSTIIVMRTKECFNRSEMRIKVGFIEQYGKDEIKIKFNTYALDEDIGQSDHFQKYIPQQGESKRFKIQKIMNKCCLISDNKGATFLFMIDFDNLNPHGKAIKYQKLDFDFDSDITVVNNFKEKILVKKDEKMYLIDAQQQKIIQINQIESINQNSMFLVYNNFIIILCENNLNIFQTLRGNKMAQINIDTILQQFQQGSTIVLKQQPKKQIRYSLLFQQKKAKITHFYLLDKEKLALYYFNINKLLERGFIKAIKENLQGLENDKEKYHQNVMKTMTFRAKKLQTLEKYLLQDLKSFNFNNTVRFLLNEPTLYVLHDGLTLFYQAVISNIARLSNHKEINVALEKEFVRICQRLITQSNYQNQIANGLQILNGVYTNFRKYGQGQGLERNREAYSKLLQTSRMTKLLKNDKKKKLFQLSYELALKIKGYKYLQSLEPSKNK